MIARRHTAYLSLARAILGGLVRMVIDDAPADPDARERFDQCFGASVPCPRPPAGLRDRVTVVAAALPRQWREDPGSGFPGRSDETAAQTAWRQLVASHVVATALEVQLGLRTERIR